MADLPEPRREPGRLDPGQQDPGREDPAPGPPPAVAETGNAAVDAALAALAELATLPAEEHGAVYEDVHERLRETLAALDNRPGPPPPARPTAPPHPLRS